MESQAIFQAETQAEHVSIELPPRNEILLEDGGFGSDFVRD